MDTEANKAIARRYFSEMVDKEAISCLRNCGRKIASFTGRKSQPRSEDGRRSGKLGIALSRHTLSSRQQSMT
jgi:hypothetical protein